MNKRRVCCFCEKWESGGIESFLHNVLMRMDFSRIEVDIVAAQICESVFTAELKERGVRFCELSGSQHKLWHNHKMFKQLLQKRQYDVVHLHIFHGLSLYYAYLAKKAGVKIRIAHGHGSGLRQSKTKFLKLLLHNLAKRLLAENPTDYWACSGNAARFMFPESVLAQREYTFISNGIEIEKFRFNTDIRKKARKELNIDKKFVIGNVGRLSREKNQDFLLEVFARVQTQKPDSMLLLVGEGDMKAELQRKAERLKITDKVIFYGVTDRVEQLLWAMDVFVFPSQFEGLGLAMIEAQAAGLPVLCSDGVPDEAVVTSFVQKNALSAGANVWAEKILQCQTDLDRQNVNDQLQGCGFAVDEVAKHIESFYLGLEN